MVRQVAQIIKPKPDPGKSTRDLSKQVNIAASIDWTAVCPGRAYLTQVTRIQYDNVLVVVVGVNHESD